MRQSGLKRQPTGAHRPAVSKSVCSLLPGSTRRGSNAIDLWEDWERARPFTSGKQFFNVGETHDVALAGASFGSVSKIPEDFGAWEELARRVEDNYVRGWVAKDGGRMFLWDDFGQVLTKRSGHFEYFGRALVKLQRKGYARPSTELWDRGGERYIGKLSDLGLLVVATVNSQFN